MINNLALTYVDLGNIEKALYYYKQIYKKKKKNSKFDKNSSMLAGIMNNMGLIYFEMGKFDKAKKYYEKSLDCREICINNFFINYFKICFILLKYFKKTDIFLNYLF